MHSGIHEFHFCTCDEKHIVVWEFLKSPIISNAEMQLLRYESPGFDEAGREETMDSVTTPEALLKIHRKETDAESKLNYPRLIQ